VKIQRLSIWRDFKADDNFFTALLAIDEKVVARVRSAGCPQCGGPLYRADYPRKPRGGLLAAAGEVFTRRPSLCCGRDGCRSRATPPSVRFLGRKVYLGVVVIVAAIIAQAIGLGAESARTTGVPQRTVKRWFAWWRERFAESALFLVIRGRVSGAVLAADLPASLVMRFRGNDEQRVRSVLRIISPITSASVPLEASLMMLG
jgi:hypothetical protein